MTLSRFFQSGSQLASTYYPTLKTVAKSVLEYPPVAHARKGFEDFFRGIYLWDSATATRNVLMQSVYSNVVEYLLPAILYRRLMTAIIERYSPDETDPFVNILDLTIVLTIFSRLYIRRMADNTFNSLSLTRAISQDVAKHLLELASEGFSENLLQVLPQFFSLADDADPAALKEVLKIKLHHTLGSFFEKNIVKADAFGGLVEPLQKIILAVCKEFFLNLPDDQELNHYAELLAKIITNDMASSFSEKYKVSLEEAKTALEKKLQQTMMTKPAKQKVEIFSERVAKVTQELKLFLPIKHPTVCHCDVTKILHAGVSSPVYYAGNHFFISIPSLLHSMGYLPTHVYRMVELPLLMLTILTYGHSFNEYKVTTEGTCIRHRYREFARNKAHSFGVGLAFYLTWQMLIQVVSLTTEVDNFFTKDALVNIVMQFGALSMLAYNEYLPGNKKAFPIDFFIVPRSLTLRAVNGLKSLAARDPEDTESRDNLLMVIHSTLVSEQFRYMINLIFGGSNFLPEMHLLYWQQKHTASMEIRDPRRVLAEIASFKQMVKFYRKDIEYIIQTLRAIYKWSTWIANPLLSLPAPGIFALLVEVLQLMKNENWEALIKKNELEMFLTFFPEEMTADEVVVAQPISHTIMSDYQVAKIVPVAAHHDIIHMDFDDIKVCELRHSADNEQQGIIIAAAPEDEVDQMSCLQRRKNVVPLSNRDDLVINPNLVYFAPGNAVFTQKPRQQLSQPTTSLLSSAKGAMNGTSKGVASVLNFGFLSVTSLVTQVQSTATALVSTASSASNEQPAYELKSWR